MRDLHADCRPGPSYQFLDGHLSTARMFLGSSGYDPDEHPEIVAEMAQALGEAAADAAYDVMREHGLKPETDPTAPANMLPGNNRA